MLFADTNIILADGSKQQGKKIYTVKGAGFFGIASAAEDADAGKTLSSKILKELEGLHKFTMP